MTTVFGTAARNYGSSHQGTLRDALGTLPAALRGPVAQRIADAGSGGLQQADIKKFVAGLPPAQRGPAGEFFGGPYKDFGHHLLAHASGEGFLMGAVFGVIALIASLVLINLKKDDLPAEPPLEAVAA